MSKNLLIIFTKNPELGKVKTRLANTIGNQNALEIYKKLLTHTSLVSREMEVAKWVYYSNKVGDNSYFEDTIFDKFIQSGEDLGERMKNAFKHGFNEGFENIVLIGSDCYELNSTHLNKAFNVLETKKFVFGPAKDGGYYLVGMNTFFSKIFENKTWSTETVLEEAILDIKKSNQNFDTIETLSDVDYEEDLKGELLNY